MIKLLFVPFLISAISSFACNSTASDSVSDDSLYLNNKGFAILELFTSEGCSSCPPADKLANEISQKAEQDNTDIFILSEHVDYWNKIGWTDPFSNASYSVRQRWYEDFFKEGSVYTPQMIVNGKSSFVGSNKQQATKVIHDAIVSTNHSQRISITNTEDGTYKFNYELKEAEKGFILNFILVEKHATSVVTRGENKGKTLDHTNIAREWISIDNPSVKGSAEFKKTGKFDKNKYSIIAFLQSKENREIVSAGIFK